MPVIKEESVIPAPPEKVWPLLRDPEVVAGCIPGAELAANTSDDVWRGSIRVKFGPTVVAFRGEAGLDFDDAARACSIKGRGIDQRGASRALATGMIRISGETETTLSVEGEFNVTGPLEGFANSGGVHVARALLAEFSANLTAVVAEASGRPDDGDDGAAAADDAPADPQPASQEPQSTAQEINGLALAWKVFVSMVAGLFGRKG